MDSLLEVEGALRCVFGRAGGPAWPPKSLDLPGFRIAVSGPKAAGKSTAVRVLLGPIIGPVTESAPTRVPIEYRWGPEFILGVEKRAGNRSRQMVFGSASKLHAAMAGIEGSHHRLVVELPSDNLRAWNMTLVDLPALGMADAVDATIREEVASVDGVLHVLHERGLSESDLAHLGRLEVPFAALVNLHDAALLPSSSAVEVYEFGLRGAALRTACPLVLAEASEKGPEWDALLMTLSALRQSQVMASRSSPMRQWAQSVADLRYERATGTEQVLENARTRLAGPRLHEQLVALHELLGLEEWFADHYEAERALLKDAEAFLRSAANADSEGPHRRAAEKAAAICRRYNRRAAARPRPASPQHPGAEPDLPAEFGRAFVEALRVLRRAIANCIEDAGALRMTPPEVLLLEEIDREVADGRVEIALLGMFSSGKSALINALLGVQSDDQSPVLLPTSVRVETSTVNRVEYASRAQLNGVEWLDEVTITLVHQDAEAGAQKYRVHEQEVRAVETWMEAQAIDLEECELVEAGERRSGGRSSAREKERALRRTIERCRDGDLFRNYVTGESDLVTQIRVRRFSKAPPRLEEGMELPAAFAAVKDPSVALRVRLMRVGYPHDLLKYGAFIDTPGTDSHVPHHRITAQGLVTQRAVPVLYCFMGSQAAGLEDRRNLAVLRSGGAEALRRVFFVVTRKGSIAERDQPEVRKRVRTALDASGLKGRGMYFIELKGEPDPEYVELRKQVEAFIKSEQRPQLVAWATRAKTVVSSAGQRAAEMLKELELAVQERRERRDQLAEKIKALMAIERDLKTSARWGLPYVRRRATEAVAESAEAYRKDVRGLRHKDAFEGLDGHLTSAFENLNEQSERRLKSAVNALLGALQSKVAELGLKAPTCEPPEGKVYFDGSAAVVAAQDIEWPFLFAIWPWGKEKLIAKHRELVSEPFERAVAAGLQKLERQVESSIGGLGKRVEALRYGLEEQLEGLKERSPAELARARTELAAAKDASHKWARFLSDMEELDEARS